MPELFETMQTMRAMRRLKPDPVPDDLIRKILAAGVCAPNGANLQTWRFLVVKDPAIKQQVQVFYKRAFDEVMGPQYRTAAPPPGVTKEAYLRQMAAVEYLTDHFHEAPVWIVACLDHGTGTPNRGSAEHAAHRACPRPGRHAHDTPFDVREGDGSRSRASAWRALLRHPPHRLSDGEVRSGGPRPPSGRNRLPGPLEQPLRRRVAAHNDRHSVRIVGEVYVFGGRRYAAFA